MLIFYVNSILLFLKIINGDKLFLKLKIKIQRSTSFWKS